MISWDTKAVCTSVYYHGHGNSEKLGLSLGEDIVHPVTKEQIVLRFELLGLACTVHLAADGRQDSSMRD